MSLKVQIQMAQIVDFFQQHIYHLFGITFYQSRVYWTDWQLNAILSAQVSCPTQVSMVITAVTFTCLSLNNANLSLNKSSFFFQENVLD